MMKASAPTPLLFHLLTQARTITSFTPPSEVAIIRRQSISIINSRYYRHAPTSFLAMSKSTHNPSASPIQIDDCCCVCGDHSGLSATFSSRTGELIPVPEHLVPESMIEWGDIPSYLEVLVSEDFLVKEDTDITQGDDNNKGDDGDDDQNKKARRMMERTTITVLPEVGCGIDNLETTKKVDEYNLQTNQSRLVKWKKDNGNNEQHEVVVLDRKIGASSSSNHHQLSVETIFQVSSEVVTEEHSSEEKIYPRRIRISFTIDTNTNQITTDTITINIERLISTTSTKGTKWTGPQSNSGGLDARSVRNTIGRDIVYGDVFGVKRVKSGGDVWTVVMDDDDDDEAVVRNNDDDYSIRLPQNILVQFYNCNKESSSESWSIELSHFDVIDSKLYKRSVLRSFDSSHDGFGSISYREEEKEASS